MAIKYQIHNIENASGTGKERQFIQLWQHQPMSADELEQAIQESSSLTPADVKAVMSQLRHFIIRELSQGNRFYLPEIGYLSLSAGSVSPEKKPNGKITGNDIFVRNIKFKPEASLLNAVRKNVKFEKSEFTTKSKDYNGIDLWAELYNYLKENTYITRQQMSTVFKLTTYMTNKWLKFFTDAGKLKKEGTQHHALYFLP